MSPCAVRYPLDRNPKLFWIDGFLRPEQCSRILEELEFARWRPSMVAEGNSYEELRSVRNPMRVSETTEERWFTPQLRRMIRAIDRRVKTLVPHLITRREEWQATRYVKGGTFDYHFDCGHWGKEPAGDRTHTVLVYLESPRLGGSTRFRELGVDVKPEPGRLLVWRNLTRQNRCDSDMLHSGAPVIAGRKTVLVTWVRQRHLPKGG